MEVAAGRGLAASPMLILPDYRCLPKTNPLLGAVNVLQPGLVRIRTSLHDPAAEERCGWVCWQLD